ncbi:NAD-dependent epimerase/dehydratase family protein [Paenibacillus sp. YN15]|uniref:NAD-dependent epimerase/dehydratase family protein n=1 Tax=Paenibacillus sp. YN15 TaxID=1742774 RepID=UPI000DCF1DE9|nr:NAD-dependent epimerase/dehydratase family protein [Paenibacillus sp. YN15]RAV01257.1 UDP-glucose 4-epimerase [Paenibacillus sp. YN15]
MKAIVTGGAGFIGSHLARELLERQWEVHVMDDLSTGHASKVPQGAALHIVDIRQPEAEERIAAIRPDIVFHLAAQADVQRSIKEPDTDAAINIIGTARILKACRAAQVRKLIFSSTSAVYGELSRERITEEDPPQPISFYGMSKWAGEQYLEVFRRLHGLPYTVLRYGNVYGPGQTAKGEGGVIALFMEKLAKNEPLRIHGDGEQTRDFIYVRDVVAANLAAVEAGDGETFQISTGHTTSVNHITRLLRELHPGGVQVQYGPARPGDIRHSCLANAKAQKRLHWQPAVSFRQGLEETYRHWFPPSG